MPQNVSNISMKQSFLLRAGVIFATSLLVVGLCSPMMTMTQFYFFNHSFSVLAGIGELLSNGQIFLAILIFLFSVLLPFGKLILLFLLSGPSEEGKGQNKLLQLMHDYGRWAMLDVLVVAVLIVSVKLGAIISVEVHWGLYVFSAAVLLIMWLTQRLMKLKCY